MLVSSRFHAISLPSRGSFHSPPGVLFKVAGSFFNRHTVTRLVGLPSRRLILQQAHGHPISRAPIACRSFFNRHTVTRLVGLPLLVVLQQAHGHPISRAPIACKTFFNRHEVRRLVVLPLLVSLDSCSISLPSRGSFHLSLTVLVHVLFHSPPGVLFTFPSRYYYFTPLPGFFSPFPRGTVSLWSHSST